MENSMRVLMVVRQFFPWAGGTEKQAQKLAAMLIEKGGAVKVVTGWWTCGTRQREVIDKIPVFRNFTLWGFFDLKGFRKFGGYIYILSLLWYLWRYRRDYDLIHIHLLSYPAFPAVLAGRWFGKKSIIKIANSDRGSDIRRMQNNDLLPGQKQMLPLTLQADCFVAINSRIIAELQAAGVPPERIVVIPNGVEVDGRVPKQSYSLGGSVRLVFVGRLHPQKGLDLLLPAFKQVVTRRPDIDWQLWVVGDGSLRSELERLAAQLELGSAVKFWGQVADVPAYLARADIFVLPSRAEGMSNALLEAMAHGLPCIATGISGNVDLVGHGEDGLLVPPDSQADLVEAILRLVDDNSLRERLGRRARQKVVAHYSINSVAERYIDLYRTLSAAPVMVAGASAARPLVE